VLDVQKKERKSMLDQIKDLIEQNKDNQEVKSYLQGFITVDGVKEFIKANKDATSWFDSERDKHATKALETFKANNLSKLLEDEIKKRYPEETPEQRELREIKNQLAQLEKEKTREYLKNKAIAQANEKGLPIDMVGFFVGEDEDTTSQNLEKFASLWQSNLQKAVEGKFQSGGRKPNPATPPKDEIERLQEEYNKAKTTHERIKIQNMIYELKKKE
jgi:predicted CopG family antitoxin